MKPPPLLLRFVHGGYGFVLLAVILLTICGLAELRARQRELTEAFHREFVRGEELDRQKGRPMQRLEERQEIVWAVIQSQLPLPEAAARFRALDRERQSATTIPEGTTTKEIEERSCRAVIAYVADVLRTSPELAAVLERLERELAEHLANLGACLTKRP